MDCTIMKDDEYSPFQFWQSLDLRKYHDKIASDKWEAIRPP